MSRRRWSERIRYVQHSGLLPGTYKLTAELPGFRTQVYNDVQLGANTTGRYNFTLQVGAVTESVEVTAERTALLAETSPTIGQVLPERQIRDLPLVSTNVLDLMKTMPGVRGAGLGTSTTAGISTNYVNTVRDSISVQEGRYENGVSHHAGQSRHGGRIRVFYAGGCGARPRQRTGSNHPRSGTMNSAAPACGISGSALNANTWQNNKQIVRGVWTPGQPAWINRNEYTASLGGPIVKNKTFFFTLWSQQFERQRNTMRPAVLTDCARNGVFRYWEGWANGNINTATSTTGANPTIQSVVLWKSTDAGHESERNALHRSASILQHVRPALEHAEQT